MAKENTEINKQGLVKAGLTLAALAGFIYITNWGPKYEIDGNKVKDKYLSSHGRTLVEHKDSDRISYKGDGKNKLNLISINGRVYDSGNPLIYSSGSERYHYLLEEIEKIKVSESESRAQKSLEKKLKKENKRRDRINRDLKILERK